MLLIGGSAVGVELGQFYARMGAQVTIVQRVGRLIDREDPRVGELAAQALAPDGVTVRAGRTATRARRAGPPPQPPRTPKNRPPVCPRRGADRRAHGLAVMQA